MKKVGIIGSTGYVGVELVRLLLNHPEVKLEAISSQSFKNQSIDSVYMNLKGITSLVCEDEDSVINKSDVIFTALPHGLSEKIALKALEQNKLVIDLGADFRITDENIYEKWYGKKFDVADIHDFATYGLPEINKDTIKTSKIIANPGCYATSIELGLLPLVASNLISTKDIICDSKSGATGAGRGLSLSTHFTECNENLSAYKIDGHRHIGEIEEVLTSQSRDKVEICFTPHLLPINRGILSTIYTKLNNNEDLETIHSVYKTYYENCPFVKLLDLGESANIKNIKYSNYCHISLHKDFRKDRLIIISCLDNMIKGAAGQAIQNMNIALGFEETAGLNLIPPAF